MERSKVMRLEVKVIVTELGVNFPHFRVKDLGLGSFIIFQIGGETRDAKNEVFKLYKNIHDDLVL